MSVIDETLAANEEYARGFTEYYLPAVPARQLVVVTCMDSRLRVYELLGLELGDAHVIRNAGGIVTEDVLRSLLVSHYLLGTRELMIINHTDCGMMTIKDEEFRRRLARDSGVDADNPARFYTFTDLRENVLQQMEKVRSHPWLAQRLVVRGFVYDVMSGRLSEVS